MRSAPYRVQVVFNCERLGSTFFSPAIYQLSWFGFLILPLKKLAYDPSWPE